MVAEDLRPGDIAVAGAGGVRRLAGQPAALKSGSRCWRDSAPGQGLPATAAQGSPGRSALTIVNLLVPRRLRLGVPGQGAARERGAAAAAAGLPGIRGRYL